MRTVRSNHSALRDPSTPAQRTARGLLFLSGSLLVACPSTAPDPIIISEVKVVGDPTSTAFALEVEGRGFGLQSVTFDVDKGTGTSSTSELAARIYRQNGGGARVFRGSSLTVETPRTLRVDVALDQPLVPGIYGLQLLRDTSPLADRDVAFEVASSDMSDAGLPVSDAGELDAAPTDSGPGDVGPSDSGPPDAGPVEDAGPPDSGFIPFIGSYQFRRGVDVQSSVIAPAGSTIVVPVPHATLVQGGKAQADGTDLRVYQGPTPLDFQWSDRVAVDTDALEIVVRLARDLPVGGDPSDPLVLYYGDPAANDTPTDGVFEFVERFTMDISPIEAGNDAAWFHAQAWQHCNANRPTEAPLPQAVLRSYCVFDSINGLARSTLASPRQSTLTANPGPNLVYEMSAWLAGRHPDGNEDIIYFSYGADTSSFDATTEVPLSDWRGLLPDARLTFRDTDDQLRTVNGWRFPQRAIQWWQRTYARLVPNVDRPSLHFRFVSTDNNSTDGVVLLDDWWVRLAVEPAPSVTLGPEQVRR